jgi:aspartyl-tRNA(Asn)/glutamyl-tRNA(Gln) amidotransferase subunit A
MMTDEFDRAFAAYDFLLGPTSPIPAFPIGSLSDDPLALKRLDYCTIPANLGGFPAISLNCGFVEGLPIGLQLMAPRHADERLLSAARLVETALPQARAELPSTFANG